MAKKPERSLTTARTAILVLGMHRSGTSALARIVNFLGAAMPRHLIPAHQSNPRGHWEPAPLVELHNQLLASLDSSWDDWRTPGVRWKESDAASRFSGTIRMTIDEEYGNAPLFVLKDPRICRTLPYWMSILEKSGIRSAPLIIVRNPLEVAESLRVRDNISFEKAMLLWLRHNLDAEYETRHLQRNIVTFDALLEDWKLLAVQSGARLGLTWPRQPMDAASDVREFLDIELHNHRATQAELETHTEVPHWVRAAYRALVLLCDEPKSAEPKRELDRVRHAFAESAKIFGSVAFAQTEALEKATLDLATAEERADIRIAAESGKLNARIRELEKFEQSSREFEAALKQLKIEAKDTAKAADEYRKRSEAADKRLAALTKEVEALRSIATDAMQLKALAKRLSDRTEWIESELKSKHMESEKTKVELEDARAKTFSLSGELKAVLSNSMAITKNAHGHEKRALVVATETKQVQEALTAAKSRITLLEADERAAQAEIAELRAELAEAWALANGAEPRDHGPRLIEAAPIAGELTHLPADHDARARRIEDDLRFERIHVRQLERRLSTWVGLASAALRKVTRLGRQPRRPRAQPPRIAASSRS